MGLHVTLISGGSESKGRGAGAIKIFSVETNRKKILFLCIESVRIVRSAKSRVGLLKFELVAL